MKIKLSVKGLKELEKSLKKVSNNLKKYEGEQKITLPYSESQWENMTDYEKEQVMESVKNDYIEKIKKEIKL